MHIKMTVMAWSNMLTNKINELTKNNGVITKNFVLRRGGILGAVKDVEIFKAKKKKFRQSANGQKTKYSVLGDWCKELALFLRGGARTGTASSVYN